MYAKVYFRHGFGDYCEVSDDETDNTMKSRTRSAIALMPAGNRQGSWHYLLLSTGKVVRRNRANCLPMPEHVITYLDMAAKKEIESGKREKVS